MNEHIYQQLKSLSNFNDLWPDEATPSQESIDQARSIVEFLLRHNFDIDVKPNVLGGVTIKIIVNDENKNPLEVWFKIYNQQPGSIVVSIPDRSVLSKVLEEESLETAISMLVKMNRSSTL